MNNNELEELEQIFNESRKKFTKFAIFSYIFLAVAFFSKNIILLLIAIVYSIFLSIKSIKQMRKERSLNKRKNVIVNKMKAKQKEIDQTSQDNSKKYSKSIF